MNDEPVTVPPLYQAQLDATQLAALLADLRALAPNARASIREPSAQRASPGSLSLDDALARWSPREGASLQLRYRYEGLEWFDTLTRTGHGARLVRVGHALDRVDAQGR